ncbi:hypothetical protein GSI_10484 [Ganoderma sinense ZZ0214-1]|uniref:Uncharacterized protein n=1 Tax=Ganoderma sinense ZZ0214-1 TaxID=1077348 RepID=A0A2G8S0S0_9APHY|nr:hypothetical protein GSI_10484 [Ganoderma sinense ZZ0214-1]
MLSLSRTISLSQVFDYEAYEHDTRDDTTNDEEKSSVLESQDLDEAALWDLDVGPLHDVRNLVIHDGVAPGPSGIEQPPSPLRGLFYDDEENIPQAGVRRESTQEVLNAALPTAGPSRTASQSCTWRALERMDSSFGSEFDASDAEVYGGSEREEDSILSEDEDEEGGPEPVEEEHAKDVVFVIHDDDDNDHDHDHEGSGGTEDGLSGAEAFEEEGPEDDAESQGDDSSDEGVAGDEATKDAPQDVPPPSSPVTGPSSGLSSGLRRSTRVRNRPAAFAPPPQCAPKHKGKGKAVAREARCPAPSKRTSTKRARSPSPSPSNCSDDSADAPSSSSSRPSKRPRPSAEETQKRVVIPAGAPTDVPCAVAGCKKMCSLKNVAGLSRHFGKHYSSAERGSTVLVRCRWGVGCKKRTTYTEVVRHVKSDHLRLRWRCERCEKKLVRADLIRRHQRTSLCKKKWNARRK